MNSKYRYILVLLAIAALFISGCSEDYTSPGQSETLRNYLVANDMDLPNMLTDWLILGSDLTGHEAEYHIVDIRGLSDYNTGHVPGSVNTTLGNILVEAANAVGKKIIVVCASGQTAGHAVIALRLSGYSDAQVLKFGMSAWHSDFDVWTAKCLNTADGLTTWIDPPGSVTASKAHSYPSITSSANDGAGILAERVAAMLAGGFKAIESGTVLTTPTAYFLNNYISATDVETYGNIQGTRRLNPMGLADGLLAHNDPAATVCTYCWTGQTSSMITAYLTVLGYDAISLKYGMNNMIYDALAGHKWTASFDYDYDTTPTLQ